jgi:hypothetical protein
MNQIQILAVRISELGCDVFCEGEDTPVHFQKHQFADFLMDTSMLSMAGLDYVREAIANRHVDDGSEQVDSVFQIIAQQVQFAQQDAKKSPGYENLTADDVTRIVVETIMPDVEDAP